MSSLRTRFRWLREARVEELKSTLSVEELERLAPKVKEFLNSPVGEYLSKASQDLERSAERGALTDYTHPREFWQGYAAGVVALPAVLRNIVAAHESNEKAKKKKAEILERARRIIAP
jgi:hypothetical protein